MSDATWQQWDRKKYVTRFSLYNQTCIAICSNYHDPVSSHNLLTPMQITDNNGDSGSQCNNDTQSIVS